MQRRPGPRMNIDFTTISTMTLQDIQDIHTRNSSRSKSLWESHKILIEGPSRDLKTGVSTESLKRNCTQREWDVKTLELDRRDVKRKDPQEKGIKQNWGETKDISTERDLKKWEMSRFKAFKRKTCQEKGASRKTHVKNKGKEKELWRESGVKKRRPQERELWRETSAKAAKRCQPAPREWDFKIRSQEKRLSRESGHIKQGQAKQMSREKWTAKRCKFHRGSQAFVGSHPAMAERFCKEMIEWLQTGCKVCFHQIKMLDRWCFYCLFIGFYSVLLHPNPWSQSHPSLFIMSLLLIPSEHQIGLNLLSPGVGRIVALDDLCWAVRHHRHTSATKHYETWP